MKATLALLVLLLCFSSAEAQGRRGRWRPQPQWQPSTYVPIEEGRRPVIDNPVPYTGREGESKDALKEVNEARARKGLRPLQPDPLLNQAAYACAQQRAARGIHGHLPESDFSYLPAGGQAAAAGCAALEPSWGWQSCAWDGPYTYGGAAWVSRGGLRFMHCFVR